MNLNELIIELLYSHDCVVIPGVGGFLLNYVPASIHPVQHHFSPPSRKIAFNAALQNNDGVLANALVQQSGIGYQESMEMVRSFAVDLNLKLQTVGIFHFEGVGSLIDDGNGLVRFEPQKAVNLLGDAYGLPSFTSPAINRGEYHAVSEPTRINRRPQRKRASFPVAARWVLMLIPLLLAGGWFLFNSTNPYSGVENASMGIETMAPRVVTPGHGHDAVAKSVAATVDSLSVPVSVLPAPAEEPIMVAQNETVVEVSEPKASSGSVPVDSSDQISGYHIIGGCFSTESNALNYVKALTDRGFKSSVEGQTRSGLYRVSIAFYSGYNSAVVALETIRNQVNGDAWLLKI